MSETFEILLDPSELGWVYSGLGVVTEIALPAGVEGGNSLEEGRASLEQRGLARKEKEGEWVLAQLVAGLAYGLTAPNAVWMLDTLNGQSSHQTGIYDLKGVHVVVEPADGTFRFIFVDSRSAAFAMKLPGSASGDENRTFSLPADSILAVAGLAKRDQSAAANALVRAGLERRAADAASGWLAEADQIIMITRLTKVDSRLQPDGQTLVVSGGGSLWAGGLSEDRIHLAPTSLEKIVDSLP